MKIIPGSKMLVVEVLDKLSFKKDENGFEVEIESSRGLKRVGIEEGKNRGKTALVSYISESNKIPNSDLYMIREEEVVGFIEDED